jgi:hypothetical protein
MIKTIDAQEKAFYYVEKGWKVLAVTTKDKRPSIRFMRYGHNSATDELDVISSWFDEIDDLNIGIACEKSGLIVLDLDYRNMCKCSWALAKQLYAETMIVETGDGVHMYFTTEALSGVKGKLASGIDIKYKGYVVAPPSVHSNGKRYEANGLEPVALPDYIREWVTK